MAAEYTLTGDLKRFIDNRLPNVIHYAQLAGQEILNIYNSEFQIENKQDNTPVTCADLAANELLVRELSQLSSEFPVLSEESELVDFEQRQQWQTYWLVDPLDGTRTFIERTGEFSVNIALIHNHRPVLGVIHSPVKDCTFYASYQKGAFSHRASQVKSIQVRSSCPATVTVAGTRSSQGHKIQKFLERLRGQFDDVDLKFMGSSLKSCMVAEGIADVYVRLGPTSEWDTAAAQCIVEEAGGRITDTRLRSLQYNTKESLLNPHFLVFGDQNIDWSVFLDDD